MEHRWLGDLEVSAIGFGAMVLSPGLYGPVDDAGAIAALRHAAERGVTLVDTSDSYGTDFHNELLIGRALGGRQPAVAVATKFGFKPPPGVERHAFPVGYAFGQLAVNADPRYIRGYAEGSLRRLRVERIDLYYPHFPDPVVPIEDTVGAMGELVSDGLVAHVGLSNVTAEQLRRALVVHPISAVQVEWSMWQSIDPALLALARAHGVSFVAWSPLGGGFLTGGVDRVGAGDYRNNVPRFAGANLQTNIDRYGPVRGLATEFGITPGQLALAWLLRQDQRVVPIPGSRSPAHIDENMAAAAVELDHEAWERLDTALSAFEPVGTALLPDVDPR